MNKLILLILTVLSNLVFSQTAAIRGKVTDATTGEELPGTNILVVGTNTGTTTDFDGNFALNKLNAGTYTLQCSFISYQTKEIKDIVIKDGEVKIVNIKLGEAALELAEVQVVATKVERTETAIITMQRKSASVLSGISSQEMSKTGASNAAAALTKVTGVTVQGGKYVYVRGLSDRYSKTTLNGADIPSLDPERNTVQMDIFPSNILDNLLVYKAFRPDLPADFTGGLVDIKTKNIPEKFTVNFSVKLGFNSQSTLRNDFLQYDGGKTDWLGIDDGTRGIPTEAKAEIPARYVDNDKLDNITKSFNKTWKPKEGFSGLNQKYTVGIGNQKEVFGKTVGFFFGGSYDYKYKAFNDGSYGRYKLTDKNASELSSQYESNIWNDGKKNTIWSLMGGLGVRLNSNSKLSYTILTNTSSTNDASYASFIDYRDGDKLREKRVLSFSSRQFVANQIKGKHNLPKLNDLKIEWIGSYVYASQNQPDVRFLTNDININANDTTYSVDNSSYSFPRRFYRNMQETNTFARIDFIYPFRMFGAKSKFKFGGVYSSKYRESFQNTISFGETSSKQYTDIQNYFADDNISAINGVYAQNSVADDNNNSYIGDQTISAGYLLADIPFLDKFRVVLGARLEKIFMETRSIQQINENEKAIGVIDTINILPSFNLTYSPKEMMNIRFAYNRTVARPSFREKSTVQMENIVGDIIIGNPLLLQTEIDNIDLRWEQYFKPGEMIAFGGFYKKFANPIEKTFNTKAQNPEITWRNVDEAQMYGLEAEFSKRLNFINATKNLFFRANLTYIYSQVSIDEQELESKRYYDPNYSDKREMFEQSPWILNATLSYKNDSVGLSANLSYTYNAKKLTIVNPNGIPDVYQKATNDLVFNINKKFGKGFIATFEVKNVLNNRSTNIYEFETKEYIFSDYGWGREFNIKLAYKF